MMDVQKLYHKCGYAILFVKEVVFPANKTYFVDGEKPFLDTSDGTRRPRVIRTCPECGGTILIERLLTQKPVVREEKGPTGYMPAKI
jgi:hypothetical protein